MAQRERRRRVRWRSPRRNRRPGILTRKVITVTAQLGPAPDEPRIGAHDFGQGDAQQYMCQDGYQWQGPADQCLPPHVPHAGPTTSADPKNDWCRWVMASSQDAFARSRHRKGLAKVVPVAAFGMDTCSADALAWERLCSQLDIIIEVVTEDVHPSDRMRSFYNAWGRLGVFGTVVALLTYPDGVRVVWNATRGRTDAAIQVIYNHKDRWWRPFDTLWEGACNGRSVRSRGKFVAGAVREVVSFIDVQAGEDEITVASLGSGSAAQLLGAIASTKPSHSRLLVTLVDKDGPALGAARANAVALGLGGRVQAFEETITVFLQRPLQLDLIEMVGLADYVDKVKFNDYMQGIRAALKQGGFFLGANITSKEEYRYAHGTFCWPYMHYRSTEEIRQMFAEAGFTQVWTGACGLYTVWCVRK